MRPRPQNHSRARVMLLKLASSSDRLRVLVMREIDSAHGAQDKRLGIAPRLGAFVFTLASTLVVAYLAR